MKYTILYLSLMPFIIGFARLEPDLVDQSADDDDDGVRGTNTTSWDFLMFTQHWPQTVCYEWKERSKGNECNLPETVDSWTVHGIWPSNVSGSDPEFCNRTWALNVTQLEPLMSELNALWPNIFKGTSTTDLWSHEWTKHGTCATSDASVFQGEFSYFDVGLQLVQKYDIEKILSESSIIPSLDKHYKVSDIEKAIQKSVGVDSVIVCYKDKPTKRYLIQELRLCLDKALSPIPCPTVVHQLLTDEQRCPPPTSSSIFYPPIQPTTNQEQQQQQIKSNSEL